MSEPRASEPLQNRHAVTVILRLVVDRRGRLVYGEVIDETATPRGHFVGWRELTKTLQRWLARENALPDL